MSVSLSTTDGRSAYSTPALPEKAPPPPPSLPPSGPAPRSAEPSYHPQVQAPPSSRGSGPSQGAGGSSPYAIPAGMTLSEAASGTQAQPFDVTLSQLATAVYGTRGDPPPGWSAVTDQMLIDRGIADPQAWRLQYLGFNDQVTTHPQEFRAQVYTDGEGNFVLSYRGTAEGAADWENNFRQGTGFVTNDGDKFATTAVNTAVEFERIFGNAPDGTPTNLAITGHSQGGGLASVGAIVTGIPAATFDASGIHPNTWDRLGIDPQQARTLAEGGQIRAYSLSSDALTNAQDSWITGLVAPDALGTQIVVAPTDDDANNMFTNYGPIENIPHPELINAGVELARNPVTGWLLGGPLAFLAGNVAYAAISHSPNALTAAMIEAQPWQPGYENPSSLGRDLQNLIPDGVKDDYSRNLHDLITDISDVAATDFANGNVVQGAGRIVGDVAEGLFNGAGDTVDGYADALADTIAPHGGWFGGIVSTGIDGAGDVIEAGADAVGQVTESIADGASWLAQGAINLFR